MNQLTRERTEKKIKHSNSLKNVSRIGKKIEEYSDVLVQQACESVAKRQEHFAISYMYVSEELHRLGIDDVIWHTGFLDSEVKHTEDDYILDIKYNNSILVNGKEFSFFIYDENTLLNILYDISYDDWKARPYN